MRNTYFDVKKYLMRGIKMFLDGSKNCHLRETQNAS